MIRSSRLSKAAAMGMLVMTSATAVMAQTPQTAQAQTADAAGGSQDTASISQSNPYQPSASPTQAPKPWQSYFFGQSAKMTRAEVKAQHGDYTELIALNGNWKPDDVLNAFNKSVAVDLSANSQQMSQLDNSLAAYAKKYPITVAVNEYAMQKHLSAHYQVSPPDEAPPKAPTDVPEVVSRSVRGAALGTSAVETVTALSDAAKAESLANSAVAAKNIAEMYAAQAQNLAAAAQAAAQQGNLQAAAALSAQAKAAAGAAQAEGATAQSLGGKAMHLGSKAQSAAKVAKILNIGAGSLAIAEGAVDLYRGDHGLSDVHELQAVASQRFADLKADGQVDENAQKDLKSVNAQLDKMAHDAKNQMKKGGVKVTCGGLVLASAFASGPAAPIVLGAVGSGCLIALEAKPIGRALKAVGHFLAGPPDPAAQKAAPPQVQPPIN